MENPEILAVNGVEYKIIKLLGKGKGGYSYLAEREKRTYVLKQIHHEPCDYYSFGNKIESELRDYEILSKIGIKMPKMIDFDAENERILKEFIDGETIMTLIERGEMKEEYIEQVQNMCSLLYPAGLNIDYFPTNFIPENDVLYYIDYECNQYSDEWNFENWGKKYWYKDNQQG
ncbi:MAG: serine/threonine protein kinase [Clostridia bacterium]|nr:serine/threonine protein kinase [Clostridia bacterium]